MEDEFPQNFSVKQSDDTSDLVLQEMYKINLRSKSIFRRISSPFNSYGNIIKIQELIESFPNPYALWLHIIKNWKDYGTPPTAIFKDCVYCGIPDELRGVVWLRLCTSEHTLRIRQEFEQYKWLPSNDEFMIDRDVNRTFPEVPMFAKDGGRGQKLLFTLLKVYSLHDGSSGYCQGISFIAGILLMKMEVEDAYVVLVYLMDVLNLKCFYSKDMTNFKCIIYQFSGLLEEHCPDLLDHFHKEDFDLSLFCCYFLTLFSTIIPLETVMHIMDVLLIEGLDVVFKVGIILLQMHETDLMQNDMENLSKYFNGAFKNSDKILSDKFMNNTKNIIIDKKLLKRLAKEFKLKIQIEQQEDEISLKLENKMLKNLNTKLDSESSTLAEKLLQMQVRLTEMEDELDLFKSMHLSVMEREASMSDILQDLAIHHDDKMEAEKLKNEKHNCIIKNYEEAFEALKTTWELHLVTCHLKSDDNRDVTADSTLLDLIRVGNLEAEVEKQELKKFVGKLKTRVSFLQDQVAEANEKGEYMESLLSKLKVELEERKCIEKKTSEKNEDLQAEVNELKAAISVEKAQNTAKVATLQQSISEIEFEKEYMTVEKATDLQASQDNY